MRILHGSRFFFKLSFIFIVSAFLILYPGQFSIEWFGYKSTMPVALLLAILFIVIGVLLFAHHCWCWFKNIPNQTKSFFAKRRIKKFEDVVIEGLTAIAAQQPEEAQSYADLARGLSPNHPLALFLTGQTSYLTKDYALAQSTFALMTEQPALKFLGLRGSVLLALERQDWGRAHSYLEQLYLIRPDSPWVLKQLELNSLKLALIDSHNTAIDMLPFYRHMTKRDATLHQGLLLWIKLKHNKQVKLNELQQEELLRDLYALVPENPVIASELAISYHKHSHKYKALRILQRSYKMAPHRLLAEAILNLQQLSDPIEIYKRIQKITAYSPHHEESEWLLTKAALNAKLWGQARHHIQPLLQNAPTKSVYQLMTEIEISEHPDQEHKADFWNSKMIETHNEWEWSCACCGTITSTWDAYCSTCGQFGEINWSKVSGKDPAPLNQNVMLTHSRII
ncbi:MAG: heme biosynthesis HemY N-terminal domain-containing protein [Candidatus Paracaedibacteraceae bacterium]|nr:heme biosynthesis HemY N-terminal domain-containing protein [Candidatus Paracaedibacteraceae bacterium]